MRQARHRPLRSGADGRGLSLGVRGRPPGPAPQTGIEARPDLQLVSTSMPRGIVPTFTLVPSTEKSIGWPAKCRPVTSMRFHQYPVLLEHHAPGGEKVPD